MARTTRMPTAEEALPGRAEPLRISGVHDVNGHRMKPPFPDGLEVAEFALGCFWGAERLFWRIPGVYTTAVGYQGGFTPNPTYEEVCTGRTGHAESVRVVFDPKQVSYAQLLKTFWENHDPTQGMQQGNDVGTQYRSVIFVHSPQQRELALATKRAFEPELKQRGFGPVTTEVVDAPEFFYAEEYHQQYLDKNPNGYCGLAGTGASCPLPTGATL